jgi:hypothetical protein
MMEDPISIILWAVFVYSWCMMPLGIMLGSECCGCGGGKVSCFSPRQRCLRVLTSYQDGRKTATSGLQTLDLSHGVIAGVAHIGGSVGGTLRSSHDEFTLSLSPTISSLINELSFGETASAYPVFTATGGSHFDPQSVGCTGAQTITVPASPQEEISVVMHGWDYPLHSNTLNPSLNSQTGLSSLQNGKKNVNFSKNAVLSHSVVGLEILGSGLIVNLTGEQIQSALTVTVNADGTYFYAASFPPNVFAYSTSSGTIRWTVRVFHGTAAHDEIVSVSVGASGQPDPEATQFTFAGVIQSSPPFVNPPRPADFWDGNTFHAWAKPSLTYAPSITVSLSQDGIRIISYVDTTWEYSSNPLQWPSVVSSSSRLNVSALTFPEGKYWHSRRMPNFSSYVNDSYPCYTRDTDEVLAFLMGESGLTYTSRPNGEGDSTEYRLEKASTLCGLNVTHLSPSLLPDAITVSTKDGSPVHDDICGECPSSVTMRRVTNETYFAPASDMGRYDGYFLRMTNFSTSLTTAIGHSDAMAYLESFYADSVSVSFNGKLSTLVIGGGAELEGWDSPLMKHSTDHRENPEIIAVRGHRGFYPPKSIKVTVTVDRVETEFEDEATGFSPEWELVEEPAPWWTGCPGPSRTRVRPAGNSSPYVNIAQGYELESPMKDSFEEAIDGFAGKQEVLEFFLDSTGLTYYSSDPGHWIYKLRFDQESAGDRLSHLYLKCDGTLVFPTNNLIAPPAVTGDVGGYDPFYIKYNRYGSYLENTSGHYQCYWVSTWTSPTPSYSIFGYEYGIARDTSDPIRRRICATGGRDNSERDHGVETPPPSFRHPAISTPGFGGQGVIFPAPTFELGEEWSTVIGYPLVARFSTHITPCSEGSSYPGTSDCNPQLPMQQFTETDVTPYCGYVYRSVTKIENNTPTVSGSYKRYQIYYRVKAEAGEENLSEECSFSVTSGNPATSAVALTGQDLTFTFNSDCPSTELQAMVWPHAGSPYFDYYPYYNWWKYNGVRLFWNRQNGYYLYFFGNDPNGLPDDYRNSAQERSYYGTHLFSPIRVGDDLYPYIQSTSFRPGTRDGTWQGHIYVQGLQYDDLTYEYHFLSNVAVDTCVTTRENWGILVGNSTGFSTGQAMSTEGKYTVVGHYVSGETVRVGYIPHKEYGRPSYSSGSGEETFPGSGWRKSSRYHTPAGSPEFPNGMVKAAGEFTCDEDGEFVAGVDIPDDGDLTIYVQPVSPKTGRGLLNYSSGSSLDDLKEQWSYVGVLSVNTEMLAPEGFRPDSLGYNYPYRPLGDFAVTGGFVVGEHQIFRLLVDGVFKNSSISVSLRVIDQANLQVVADQAATGTGDFESGRVPEANSVLLRPYQFSDGRILDLAVIAFDAVGNESAPLPLTGGRIRIDKTAPVVNVMFINGIPYERYLVLNDISKQSPLMIAGTTEPACVVTAGDQQTTSAGSVDVAGSYGSGEFLIATQSATTTVTARDVAGNSGSRTVYIENALPFWGATTIDTGGKMAAVLARVQKNATAVFYFVRSDGEQSPVITPDTSSGVATAEFVDGGYSPDFSYGVVVQVFLPNGANVFEGQRDVVQI